MAEDIHGMQEVEALFLKSVLDTGDRGGYYLSYYNISYSIDPFGLDAVSGRDQPIPDVRRITVYPGKIKITLTDAEVEVPFEPVQSGRSFLIPNNVSIRDPLDLPVPQLKALVQGTIWRDEHFAGMSMRDIANRAGTDERHVRRLITNSLTII
ncbi:MAG: hypothetical protein JNM12_07925 [Alphaproteobacteria bacterium]|nr:hypothetical protein [Alphaproteobacteria bacterium]